MACCYEGCFAEEKYCIEWNGVNQHGENPVVAYEANVCGNPRHIIDVSQDDEYGGYPDCIYSFRDLEGKPKLLALVKRAIDGKLEEKTIDNLVLIADPGVEQLVLF